MGKTNKKSLERSPLQGSQVVMIPHGTKKIQLLNQIIEEYRLRLLSTYPDKKRPLPDECKHLRCILGTEKLILYFGADARNNGYKATGSVQVLPQKQATMPAELLSRYWQV